MRRKTIAMFCAATMLCCLLAPLSTAQAADNSGTLRILFTHDMHDHILPYKAANEAGAVSLIGGYAYMKSAMDKYRTDTTVQVDAGDFSMGTLFNGIFETDAPDLTLLGMMGYDAVTLGNHEFDYGPEGLAKSLLAAKNPPKLLASNMHFSDEVDSQALKSAFTKVGGQTGVGTTTFVKNGVQIGIFGLMGDEASDDIAYPGSVTFDDRFETAKKFVSALQQQGAQVIICLSHSGTAEKMSDSEDVQLAKKVAGIDVIISAHSHTLLSQPIVVGDTTIVSCGCYGKSLGVLDLDLSTKTASKYEIVPITQDFTPDETIAAQIESYKKDVDTQFLSKYNLHFDDVVAKSGFNFDDININYEQFRDSNMGDFVADAHVYAYKKHGGTENAIGISAKGIVRDTLCKGDVTLNDAYSVTSVGRGEDGTIGDPLALVYLNGNELRQTCEIVASMQSGNTQMYFNGMKYTYMDARPFGDKVVDVEVQDENGNWQSIESGKLYPVVCNLYIAQMLPVVTKQTHKLFSITPKDKNGNATTDYEAMTLCDSLGREVKDWTSFVEYLQSFPKEDGVSVIPDNYQTARATKTALPFSLSQYFSHTSRLGVMIYAALTLVVVLSVFIVRKVGKKKKHKALTKK